jgi:pSer/pThr/pTyr-binding forkhead associated (FHA) protein
VVEAPQLVVVEAAPPLAAAPTPARIVRLSSDVSSLESTAPELKVASPAAVPARVSVPPGVIVPRQSVSPAAGRPVDDFEAPDSSLMGMPPPPSMSHAAPRSEGRGCSNCGAMVPEGFKFCGVCGTRYEVVSKPAESLAPVEEVEYRARLVLIHPDGSEGEGFPLEAGETTVGRNHALPLFCNDPFLSPRHATFFFVRGQLFVRDEASLNGIFLRIKAEVELFHRDMFRIGQQLLRFEEMSQVRPVVPGAGDGTTVMGSPVRGAWGRLALVVGIDTMASIWALRRPEEQLGRERGEVVFPEDGFVSGAHCKLVTRDGRFFLRDIGSTNGSYLRIKGEGILAQGDLILLGQQLFKIDLLS